MLWPLNHYTYISIVIVNTYKMEDKLIKRIQKLSAKAESSKKIGNIDEAAAFSAKVNELLITHNLAMADLDTDDQDSVDGIKYTDLGLSKKYSRWTVNLLTVLCKYNYCKSVYLQTSLKKNKTFSATIIGRPENVEVVIYLYEILKREFEKMASVSWKSYLKDIREKLVIKFSLSKSSLQYKKPWTIGHAYSGRGHYMTSFYRGAIQGIISKLDKEMDIAEEAYGSKITDLVIVNDAAVNEYMKENYNNLARMRSSSGKVNGDAYSKGKKLAESSSMAKGVATGSSVATKHIS